MIQGEEDMKRIYLLSRFESSGQDKGVLENAAFLGK